MSFHERVVVFVLIAAIGSACAAEVTEEKESAVAAAPAPSLDERLDGFLNEHSLPESTRRALLEFAHEQRAIARASRDARRPPEARALRSRRHALRERGDTILTEMPDSLRAAMRARRLTIHNLARAVERASRS